MVCDKIELLVNNILNSFQKKQKDILALFEPYDDYDAPFIW